MLKKIPEVGDRVKVLSLNLKATVTYVDMRNIYIGHFYPIQVELDEPWESSIQTTHRTSIDDLRALKKKVKK